MGAGPQLGEPSHWAVAAGVGVGVTAARQVLLAVWPDFAAASKRANEQVRLICYHELGWTTKGAAVERLL